MYSVIEKNQSTGNTVQFIKVMSTIPRKMVIIPLTGYTKFGGTIKVILDFHKQRLELHTTNELGLIENKFDTVIPLDAGISEVFMDEIGNAYEPTFGKTIGEVSKQLNKTMKARNKSYALKKTSSKHKAHRIAKFNLGKNKLRERKRKAQVRIKQQISHAIHQVVKERKPGVIVTEQLDIRGKAKSKGISRLVSYWMRGSLKERLEFLALAEGFCHKQVNPAYTSQMCPTCLFVHKGNRAGDIFHCLNCGQTDHADRVAAINLLARYYDTEITVYTPKSTVFSILQRRFAASLEKSNGLTEEVPVELTVSGRTDTDGLLCQSETPSSKSNNGRGTEMSCLTMF
jgi:IS605 OrfB family transposase